MLLLLLAAAPSAAAAARRAGVPTRPAAQPPVLRARAAPRMATVFASDSAACSAEALDERVELTLTTFNVLNPIFARINAEGARESTDEQLWLARNEAIVRQLCASGSDVLCLQEYWVGGPPSFHELYERELCAKRGYTRVVSAREGRADGCLTLLGPRVSVVGEVVEVHFGSFADRVAHIVQLRVRTAARERGGGGAREQPAGAAAGGAAETLALASCPAPELLLVNTHLTYPHAPYFSALRLHEVRALVCALDAVRAQRRLRPCFPVVLCGDFNGSPSGNVFKAMLAHGFVSAVDQLSGVSRYAKRRVGEPCAPRSPLARARGAAARGSAAGVAEALLIADATAGAPRDDGDDGEGASGGASARWITHRTHTGRCSGVDYIWLSAQLPATARRSLAPLQRQCVRDVVDELGAMLVAAEAAETAIDPTVPRGTASLSSLIDAAVAVVFRSDAEEWAQREPVTPEQAARERAAYQRALRERAAELLGVLPSMLERHAPPDAAGAERDARAGALAACAATPAPRGVGSAEPAAGAPAGDVRVRYGAYLAAFAERAAALAPPLGGSGGGGGAREGWAFEATRSVLQPEELMAGRWPDSWRLSDHGLLSATLVGTRNARRLATTPAAEPHADARAPAEADAQCVELGAVRNAPAAMQVPICRALGLLHGGGAGGGGGGADGDGAARRGPGGSPAARSALGTPLRAPLDGGLVGERGGRGGGGGGGGGGSGDGGGPSDAPNAPAGAAGEQRGADAPLGCALRTPPPVASCAAGATASDTLAPAPPAPAAPPAPPASFGATPTRGAGGRSPTAARQLLRACAPRIDVAMSGAVEPEPARAQPATPVDGEQQPQQQPGRQPQPIAAGARAHEDAIMSAERSSAAQPTSSASLSSKSMPEAAMTDTLLKPRTLRPAVITRTPLWDRAFQLPPTAAADGGADASGRAPLADGKREGEVYVCSQDACEPLSDALARLIALDEAEVAQLEAQPELDVQLADDERALYERALSALDYFGDWADPATTRDSIVLACESPCVIDGEFTCADGAFRADRAQLHARILSHLLPHAHSAAIGEPISGAGGARATGPRRAYIVVGVPGSGKDSVLKRYLQRANAGVHVVDASADRLKGFLAQWADDELCREVREHCKRRGSSKHLLHAQYLHRESIYIVQRLVQRLISTGLPFMLEKTLYWLPQIVEQVSELRAAGYEVHLYGTLISPLKNWEFLNKRAQSGQSFGRLISKEQAVQALRRYHANLELVLRDPTLGQGVGAGLSSVNLYDVLSGEWKLRLLVPKEPMPLGAHSESDTDSRGTFVDVEP